MKNNKAFTLIELLAVIVILAVIALIVTPTITGVIEAVKKAADLRSVEGYVKAADNFFVAALLDENKEKMLDNKTNVLNELEVNNNKATGNVTIDSNGNVTISIIYNNKCYRKEATQGIDKIEVSDNINNCIIIYKDSILNGADPVLSEGMFPVIMSNDGTVTKADLNSTWYDYSENAKQWANMVIVNETSRQGYKDASAGTPINSADIMGYFVWIPRYSYQLFNAEGIRDTAPVEIQIRFENKDIPKSSGEINGEWLTPPGFEFDSKPLNGIWLAKFETTGDETTPTVLPNLKPIVYKDISTFFKISQKFNEMTKYGINNDSHMAKNNEWAVAVYISHSKYGINKEVRINNYKAIQTGCGAKTDGEEISSSECGIAYGSNVSEYPQSITGNITGVFDMSGCGYENLMGVYADEDGTKYSGYNAADNSGFNGRFANGALTTGVDFPNPKYYEIFKKGQGPLGEALTETSGWYDDYKYTLIPAAPWIFRGGSYGHNIKSGIFNYANVDGGPFAEGTFRTVLIP